MKMTPALRTFIRTIHIICSVGWVGAVIGYIALVIGAHNSQDPQVVRAMMIAMETTMLDALVPLAVSAWLTGILLALVTPWGLIRHYWVIAKLILSTLALIVMLNQVPLIRTNANMISKQSWTDFLHPIGGLLVLLLITALSVYKPRGLTRYGWRKERECASTTTTKT